VWNATLGSAVSSTTASSTITFSDVVPGSYAWDIVTHNNPEYSQSSKQSDVGCNFGSFCETGNFTAQTSSGVQYQYNTEVLNSGTYTYDNNSGSSPLVIPTSGTPANNAAQGLSCTGTTCTISVDFVAQYELDACVLPAGSGGFGGEGGLCNDSVPPTNPGGYVQLSVTSGSGPQPNGYTVESDVTSGVFNGAFGIFFNTGTKVSLTGVPLTGDGATTWTSDPQASGDGCSTQGGSGTISVTIGTSCYDEAMNFFGISPTTGVHTSSVTITLSGSAADSSTYSYCFSTSSSSISCVSGVTYSGGGTFTTSSSGNIPNGVTLTIPANTVHSAGTYYVIIYSGTTIVGYATFTYSS
jgi:hypothetical protein